MRTQVASSTFISYLVLSFIYRTQCFYHFSLFRSVPFSPISHYQFYLCLYITSKLPFVLNLLLSQQISHGHSKTMCHHHFVHKIQFVALTFSKWLSNICMLLLYMEQSFITISVRTRCYLENFLSVQMNKYINILITIIMNEYYVERDGFNLLFTENLLCVLCVWNTLKFTSSFSVYIAKWEREIGNSSSEIIDIMVHKGALCV